MTLLNNFSIYLDAAKLWQIGFQDLATPVIKSIINFYGDLFFYFFFLITTVIFVCWLLCKNITLFNNIKKKYIMVLYFSLNILFTMPKKSTLITSLPDFDEEVGHQGGESTTGSGSRDVPSSSNRPRANNDSKDKKNVP